MKLLLDTHAALWWLADDDRLGSTAADLIGDSSNDVLLSAAVVWEIGIKRSIGKLDVPDGFVATLLEAGVRPLSVDVDHAGAVAELPMHHRDPFDRILIAQAAIEQAVLVSNDPVLPPYGVSLAW